MTAEDDRCSCNNEVIASGGQFAKMLRLHSKYSAWLHHNRTNAIQIFFEAFFNIYKQFTKDISILYNASPFYKINHVKIHFCKLILLGSFRTNLKDLGLNTLANVGKRRLLQLVSANMISNPPFNDSTNRIFIPLARIHVKHIQS